MQLGWLSWSNPVAVWWCFLVLVSAGNVALLLSLAARVRKASLIRRGGGAWVLEPLFLLAAIYVFGCAFRSVLPRADVQRICLFDTWLSSVAVGRSVATVAEICFVVQWAIVVRMLAKLAHVEAAHRVAGVVVPLVVLAEGCSWYAVISTDYLGNVLENSLWTLIFLLIGVALLQLFTRYQGAVQAVIAAAIAGIAGYVVFMCVIDVPMYVVRWHAELASGKESLGLLSGLHDLATRWVVTYDIARWDGEIAWMTLYFSAAVWTSLVLASFPLLRHLVLRCRAHPSVPKPARGPLPAPVRSRPTR